ncbi:sucrose-specific PTS transporter subunit IIBC [Tepidibacter formicigenes]|jgi:PTS system beta-glucosides-specific IIC component/PTS system sucrose-specific IIC component|uniref:PTS system, sucrose-specific IIC component n=1 Tax=Tepidibacter formicigenes DSM 15518 TaxID=1123349 RepID=A0A1M6LD63_9FIRM|nr:sucrose-specific PTS transporter subunit IIBC [Tepidibacter formicigenes]SHJ69015.1 PTS system, sucrose-specific IIC component [Tepidibacter formicigenes DSM 15518]
MNYAKTANEILKLVGGKENIESCAHCATRLRLVLKDEKKADKKSLESMNEVKGVFSSAGQFQIILGQGIVNKVYKALVEDAGIKESSTSDAKRAAMKNMNPLQRFARILSNIFVPIIPAIVASGLLMGALGMSKTFGWIDGNSGLFTLLDMFSNAAFVFLPILIAFSAAKEFGANPYLAAALGGILIHPALQNAWTVGGGIEKTIEVFGMKVGMVGYQGTVLPILIAVWVMSHIERNLRKVVPNALDIIVTPFLTIMLTGFISLLAIGPLGRLIGDGISIGLQSIYSSAGALAGLLFGGVYSSIVITGIHHSFHAIEAGLLSNPEIGKNFLLPIWSMANVAQGGAALAVYFKTKDDKLKSIAVPAATSCLLGITEAAIFGVNLRLVKPFIAAAIAGALGGAYVVFTKVAMTAVGLTGIPGTAIVEQGSMINYMIGLIIAFGSAFIATYILGFKEKVEQKDEKKKKEIILSPLKGKVMPIENVPDSTFSEKILGDGIAINPESGLITSPVDGEIVQLFDTKHAVGIKSNSGVELLIHVGIDTVNMKGEGFKAFIKTGDKVKAGDKLLDVDLDLISKKAKSTITPIIITNSSDFKSIEFTSNENINNKEELININLERVFSINS